MDTHDTIPEDELFELLANAQRRRLLRRLAAADGPVTENELVEALGVEADRETRAIALHHCHIPKLEAHDVVETSPSTGTVEPGAALDDAVAALRQVSPRSEAELRE